MTDILHALRAPANDENETPQPAQEWFVDRGQVTHVSRYSISNHADRGYKQWMALDPRIDFNVNIKTGLESWITNTPDDVLLNLIGETLEGVDADEHHAAFKFTPWQRMAMIAWVDPPFDMQATASIPANILQDIANYAPGENRRKIPMYSSFGRYKDNCPETTILDIPTAGGKTSMSIAMALLLLSPRRFEGIIACHRRKRSSTIFPGLCDVLMARLCIIATSGNTFDHFETTLKRVMPAAQRKYPDHTFVVWTTMSKHNSVQKALDLTRDGRTIVFWCIPIGETMNVLRKTPDVSVACLITDEYATEPPRERSKTTKSHVFCNMILQATPQALVRATTGHKGWLTELMDGPLLPPMSVAKLIRCRRWTEAQRALDQACKLHLMTMTYFRDRIRNDLHALLPNGMDVLPVRSRSLTLAAFVSNSAVDMVPANFSSVLLNYLRTLRLSDASILSIQTLSSRVFTMRDLLDVVRSITLEDASVPTEHTLVQRLCTRIEEASTECPVCYQDACGGQHGSPNVFGCCGFIVCSACFDRVSHCPFCREIKPSSLPRADVPNVRTTSDAPEVISIDSDDDEPVQMGPAALYPPNPYQSFGGVRNLSDDLYAFTSSDYKQVDNVVNTLHVLQHHAYHRVIIIVEKASTQLLSAQLDNFFNARMVGHTTGYQIHRVDTTLGGKGSQFTRIKRQFDDLSLPPQALLCYGLHESFLYGTDLGNATALVAVGEIGSDILTQALGRIYRPVVGRDPTKPIKVVKIYTGSANRFRRPRVRDEFDDGLY